MQACAASDACPKAGRALFPILSDPGNEVAARFGNRFKLPDYLIELYKDVVKNDLALTNGDPRRGRDGRPSAEAASRETPGRVESPASSRMKSCLALS
jgi:hypothetical protein